MNALSYARERRALLLAWVGQAGILAVVWVLSPGLDDSLVNLFYSLLLMTVVGAAGFGFDFLRYRTRVAALARIPEPPVARRSSRELAKSGDYVVDFVQDRDQRFARILAERERASREDIEFFGAWIHELKTPVSVLRLVMPDSEADSSGRRQLDRLEQNLDRAMFYLRSSSLSSDMMLRSVDLRRLVRERVAAFQDVLDAHDLSFTMDGQWFEVSSDPKWLGFIVDQVFQNALRYTPSGGRIVARASAHPVASLAISDTGCGIPDSELPRVFDRGFTGTRGREYAGSTGMGLYLARKLSDRLGHRIRVDSSCETPDGESRTTVTIVFPRWGDAIRQDASR